MGRARFIPATGLVVCFLLSAYGTVSVAALYASNSNVIHLDSKTFNREVMSSDHLWLVEFYAPWCGHCRSLAPEWERAATQLKGIVKVAGVDCDQHKDLAQRFGIQGFPTIKVFGPDKKKPTDYQQERTAKAIIKYALDHQPSFVTQVSEKTFEKFSKSPLPKALLFTNKKATTSLYKALSSEFSGRMTLGQVLDSDKTVSGLFDVTSAPTLVAYKDGEDHTAAVKYDGDLNIQALIKFLDKFALPPKEKKPTSSAKPSKSGSRSGGSSTVKGNPNDVAVLTSKNFDKIVMQDEAPWMVEFYAPWCGHCKSLKPEWEKAATGLKHIFKFGMIDATQETDLAQKYGIKGYPTILSFPFGKNKKHSDYGGARTATEISNYAVSLLPSNLVSKVSASNVEAFTSKVGTKVLVFGSKSSIPPMVKAFSISYNGLASFGFVDPSESETLAKYSIDKTPAIVVLNNEGGLMTYRASMKPADIINFFEISGLRLGTNQSGSNNNTKSSPAPSPPTHAAPVPSKPVQISQLQAAEDYQTLCGNVKRHCVIFFVNVENKSSVIEAITSLATKYKKDPLAWMWIDRELSPAFSSALGVDNKSDISVSILHTKRMKYTVVPAGSYSDDGIGNVIDEILSGTRKWELIGSDGVPALPSSK